MLADDARPHWQARTVPAFEAQLSRACPECRLVTHVADGDAAVQADQLAEAVEDGADAVVLAPTSATAGAELVASADEVPVVALDGALPGAAHVVTTDGAAVGRQQAAAVVAALGGARDARRARVLLLDGADSGAEQARRSALRQALRRAGVRPVDAAGLTDQGAAAAAEAVRAAGGAGAVDAVVAASDVQAGGAREALGARRVPVVGAGADLDAVRRLVTGAQAATVWSDDRALGSRAAAVAGALAAGLEPRPRPGTEVVAGVPTDVVAPRPVTLDEVARLLVRRGVVSVEEVCDADTRAACERAGLV
nr:substrate-binding domain-containing protein [Nocardioides perillae]